MPKRSLGDCGFSRRGIVFVCSQPVKPAKVKTKRTLLGTVENGHIEYPTLSPNQAKRVGQPAIDNWGISPYTFRKIFFRYRIHTGMKQNTQTVSE